jgi:hypothetical protein
MTMSSPLIFSDGAWMETTVLTSHRNGVGSIERHVLHRLHADIVGRGDQLGRAADRAGGDRPAAGAGGERIDVDAAIDQVGGLAADRHRDLVAALFDARLDDVANSR